MQLIDSHCHLDLPDFESDREAVLARARQAGVTDMIVPAIEAATWDNLSRIATLHPQLHAAYGLHPMFMQRHSMEQITRLDEWLKQTPAVAVGECGLDFYIANPDRQAQTALFEAQLEVARRHRLPVIIHARKAVEEVILSLRQFPELSGVLHSYSGSQQQAERLMEMGFYLSFGGPVTHAGARKLHQLVSALPLDRLLLESDAPDQPDAKHRGERNEPAYLGSVVQAISHQRGISAETLAAATTENARRLFGLARSMGD